MSVFGGDFRPPAHTRTEAPHASHALPRCRRAPHDPRWPAGAAGCAAECPRPATIAGEPHLSTTARIRRTTLGAETEEPVERSLLERYSMEMQPLISARASFSLSSVPARKRQRHGWGGAAEVHSDWLGVGDAARATQHASGRLAKALGGAHPG